MTQSNSPSDRLPLLPQEGKIGRVMGILDKSMPDSVPGAERLKILLKMHNELAPVTGFAADAANDSADASASAEVKPALVPYKIENDKPAEIISLLSDLIRAKIGSNQKRTISVKVKA